MSHADLDLAGLLSLFAHFLVLSLLSIGGAISVAPDMHRYLVGDRHWLVDAQFSAAIAIAQAAPGPNVLFVAVLGWQVAGIPGAIATMTGILIPSTVLSLAVSRFGHSRRDARWMRAVTAGLMPLTLGLLAATGWVLAGPAAGHPGAMLLVAATIGLMIYTRLSPMWAIAAGAAIGAFGVI